MERLPYIDDHARAVNASPERVWRALLATIGVQFGARLPAWLVAAWGLEQASRSGSWSQAAAPGDTVPGFAVVQSEAPRLLTLRGRHRFSEYELRFALEELPDGGVELQATTCATFPGLRGRIYRGLVIGTGGHRIVVRRLLGRIAGQAERGQAPAQD